MTVGDVMELAPLYHKYDFPKGLELSGHVLKEYIQAAKKADHAPDDIDFLVDAILLADACHLDEALNAGVHFIDTVILYCPHRSIFSKDHIAKLAPLIAKEETLFATVQLFIKSGVTKEDILHRFFPELLVEKFASYQKCVTMLDLVSGRSTRSNPGCGMMLEIKLSGSGCSANGDYIGHFFDNRPNDAVDFTHRGFRFGGQDTKFMITVRDDIWVIVGHQEAGDTIETIFWERPDSYSLMVPPRDGWVPVDISEFLALGKSPNLMYLTHEVGRSKDST
jgi:hypothetical protein